MKRLLLSATLALLIATAVEAAPFLVCAPYPKTGWQPTFFTLVFDGSTNPITAPVTVNPDGSVQLKYDLSAISTGSHTVNIRSGDTWGISVAVPFQFTRPLSPVEPQSIAVVP